MMKLISEDGITGVSQVYNHVRKQSGRGLFSRIAAYLVLAGLILYCLYAINKQRMMLLEERLISYEMGCESIRGEALRLGYGEYILNDFTEVEWKWFQGLVVGGIEFEDGGDGIESEFSDSVKSLKEDLAYQRGMMAGVSGEMATKIGFVKGKQEAYMEAVSLNFGEYVVDESGFDEFIWNTNIVVFLQFLSENEDRLLPYTEWVRRDFDNGVIPDVPFNLRKELIRHINVVFDGAERYERIKHEAEKEKNKRLQK